MFFETSFLQAHVGEKSARLRPRLLALPACGWGSILRLFSKCFELARVVGAVVPVSFFEDVATAALPLSHSCAPVDVVNANREGRETEPKHVPYIRGCDRTKAS